MGNVSLNLILMTAQEEQHIHQNLRKQCWLQAAAAVASAPDCKESRAAINWADKILYAFDERFPMPNTITTTKIKES